jgi:pilus assembly protein CpaC
MMKLPCQPKILVTSLCAAALLVAALAFAQEPVSIELFAGQSTVVKFDFNVDKLAVGDPETVGVGRTGDREMLINAKKPGSTNILAMGANGEKKEFAVRVLSGTMAEQSKALAEMLSGIEGVRVRQIGPRIVVDGEVYSSESFDRIGKLLATMPEVVNQVGLSQVMKRIVGEQIRKEIGRPGVSVKSVKDSFVLDGVVFAPEEADRAVKIAKLYSNNVVNALRVAPEAAPKEAYVQPKLIEVTMNIVEVSKSALRDLGVHWNPLGAAEASGTSTVEKGIVTTLTGIITGLAPKMRRIVDDGKGRSLINQSVITRAGGQAKFFAGTEMPITVSQSLGTMSVEYKKIGMTLNVSPIIDPGKRIDTSIQVESSAITGEGMSNAPIVSTNNLSTMLNVDSGVSIALGGLISQRELLSMSQSPPDKELSLLQLNARKRTGVDDTEVIVFVTPRVIESAGQAAADIDEKVRKNFKKRDLEELREKAKIK